jgi:hypothetical protein
MTTEYACRDCGEPMSAADIHGRNNRCAPCRRDPAAEQPLTTARPSGAVETVDDHNYAFIAEVNDTFASTALSRSVADGLSSTVARVLSSRGYAVLPVAELTKLRYFIGATATESTLAAAMRFFGDVNGVIAAIDNEIGPWMELEPTYVSRIRALIDEWRANR